MMKSPKKKHSEMVSTLSRLVPNSFVKHLSNFLELQARRRTISMRSKRDL